LLVRGLEQMAAHEVAEDLRALPQLVSRLAHVAQDAHAAAVGRVLRGAFAADERLRAVLKDEVAGMHRAAAAELLVHPELKRAERPEGVQQSLGRSVEEGHAQSSPNPSIPRDRQIGSEFFSCSLARQTRLKYEIARLSPTAGQASRTRPAR
jgi:hypothetical protein